MIAQTIVLSTLAALAAAAPSTLAHHVHKRSDGESVSGSDQGKGIAYTPYTNDGQCKSLETIVADLKPLSGYEVIRLYGTDCNQVANVLQAKTSNQTLFLEVYDMSSIAAEVETIKSAVEAHGSWDDVYTVSIGNELVNSGAATVSDISSYVETGRSALTASGYTGPVVSVDTFVAVINNPGLCDLSDYIAVNCHAYFDGGVTAENAGKFVLEQIQRVWEACDGKKKVFISESGWPYQGNTNGVAVPSKENQVAAMKSLTETVGDDVVLFSAYDDKWKADGSYDVEKYWGILA